MNGRTRARTAPAMVLILGIMLMVSSALAKDKTFTGTVSDAMCGAKHMSEDAAGCTRGCVGKGSQYALVVGDKVYKLETTDKTALAALDKQAGSKATVKGTEKGDSITVSSVAP